MYFFLIGFHCRWEQENREYKLLGNAKTVFPVIKIGNKRNKESKSIRMTLTKNFQRENHSQCEKKILKDLIQ